MQIFSGATGGHPVKIAHALPGTKKSSPFEAADPLFDGVLAQNVLQRLLGVLLDKILQGAW